MASSIFIGRWTPKILFSLRDKSIAMGSCAASSGACQRTLTRTLRNLESAGLIARHDAIEGHHGRIFIDQTGKDNHRSTRRHLPLGEAIPQGRER